MRAHEHLSRDYAYKKALLHACDIIVVAHVALCSLQRKMSEGRLLQATCGFRDQETQAKYLHSFFCVQKNTKGTAFIYDFFFLGVAFDAGAGVEEEEGGDKGVEVEAGEGEGEGEGAGEGACEAGGFAFCAISRCRSTHCANILSTCASSLIVFGSEAPGGDNKTSKLRTRERSRSSCRVLLSSSIVLPDSCVCSAFMVVMKGP